MMIHSGVHRVRRLSALTVIALSLLLVAGVVESSARRRGISDPPRRTPTVPESLATAVSLRESPITGGGSLPVAFVENQGQWDCPASHVARLGPMTVFLEDRGWTFTLIDPDEKPRAPADGMAYQDLRDFRNGRGVAVRMRFGGSVGVATPLPENLLPGVHHYFLGNDPGRWRRGVPLHGAVVLSGLYRGIDVRARSEGRRFEYDLLVGPGAALEKVVVEVEGAEPLRLDADGALVIETALGPVRQPPPPTWQVGSRGERQELDCRYVLLGSTSFGFEAPGRNLDLALVVDPGLVYSTYLGGSFSDTAVDVAVSVSGGVTLCGYTDSLDYPFTAGAYGTTNSGNLDSFVARLDPAGGALVYSTYLGGSGNDFAQALAVDATGVTTVCGALYSTDFPTTAGAYDTTYNGATDGFVTRLDASGSALLYSTYLGGTGADYAYGLDVDSTGAATVCGGTDSADFPTTVGAFDTTHNGDPDAFVTRLGPSGGAVVWSTFIGGSGTESAAAVVRDATGAVTLCGNTFSSDFPTTAGAFDETYNGSTEGFVSRLDSSGSALVYSTYLGGSGQEGAEALGVDSLGAVTVCGTTWSSDFPTTAGAFDTTFNGGWRDGFVTRLDTSGSFLIYSTFVGDSGNDYGNDLALDGFGAATICGSTSSSSFPVTAGGFDTTHNGGNDGYLTRLDPWGSVAIYSTYLGGYHSDSASALALDVFGAATVCGTTQSNDYPTSTGAFDTSHNGGKDVFLTRIDIGVPAVPLLLPGVAIVPVGQPIQLQLWGPAGSPFAVAVDLASGLFPTPYGDLGLAVSPAFGILIDGIGSPSPLHTIGPSGGISLFQPPPVAPLAFSGLTFYLQALVVDSSAPSGFVLSWNGLSSTPNAASSSVTVN